MYGVLLNTTTFLTSPTLLSFARLLLGGQMEESMDTTLPAKMMQIKDGQQPCHTIGAIREDPS